MKVDLDKHSTEIKDENEKKIEGGNDECIFTVDKNVYKRFQIIKAQLSSNKGKVQTWDEFFYDLLCIERKHRNYTSWLHTIEMFFITTFILAFPFYLSSPLTAIWMMPIFLIMGFIVAYIMTYIFTLYPMKGIVPFKDAPPKILEYINDLSKKAGIDKPVKLMIMETPEINAMVYSNMNEHRICLTRGIVDIYGKGKISDDELKAVLGHEIGHIVNLDSLKKMLTLSFACIFDMIGNMWIFIGKGMANIGRKVSREERSDTGGIIGFMIVIIGWVLYLSGIVQKLIAKAASLISFKVSRKHEYAADLVGAELTSPETMAVALKKIVDLGNELMAADLESLPYAERWQLEPRNPSWIDKLSDTHPSMEDRRNELMIINKYL